MLFIFMFIFYTFLQVEEVFSVPDVGPVVGGTLLRGTVREGEELIMGPTISGKFLPVLVTSIRRNRAPCMIARAGQAASLSLDFWEKDNIRKVM